MHHKTAQNKKKKINWVTWIWLQIEYKSGRENRATDDLSSKEEGGEFTATSYYHHQLHHRDSSLQAQDHRQEDGDQIKKNTPIKAEFYFTRDNCPQS